MRAAIAAMLLSGATLSAGVSNAAEVAVRAPIGCAASDSFCEHDISASEAISLANNFAVLVAACAADPTLDRDRCDLPPLLESHICQASSGHRWAYAADLRGGHQELDELLQRLKSGEVFEEYKMIVEAAESPPGEQHLALCYVRVVEGAAGPPRDCTTVAVLVGDSALLRIGTNSTIHTCLASASMSLGGKINVNFEITTSLAGAGFVDALHAMLKQQLGFATVERVEHGTDGAISFWQLVAASPLRDSPILQNGWRESLDLDLNVMRSDAGFSVYASTKPLVSRTASGSMVEYHYPDDAQRGMYMQTLNTWIGGALTGVCASLTVFDDTTFQCN